MPFSKILYLVLALTAVCCSKQPPPSTKPQILVSITPYLFFAERVAGPDFDVTAVVPSASNPHTFEPTTNQVSAMGKSRVWLRIGEPFEKKIIPILQSHNRELVVADLREGIEMLKDSNDCKYCSPDHFDRHIWLSPKLAKKQAAIIEKTLSEIYPEKRDVFQKNLLALSDELDQLDTEIRAILQNNKSRSLLVSHPALGYFCHDFGLEQLSVEYEGKDPLPKQLDDCLKRAIATNTQIVLVLPQHNNKGALLIAEKLKKPVEYIDPYSSNYCETIRKLANLIANTYAD